MSRTPNPNPGSPVPASNPAALAAPGSGSAPGASPVGNGSGGAVAKAPAGAIVAGEPPRPGTGYKASLIKRRSRSAGPASGGPPGARVVQAEGGRARIAARPQGRGADPAAVLRREVQARVIAEREAIARIDRMTLAWNDELSSAVPSLGGVVSRAVEAIVGEAPREAVVMNALKRELARVRTEHEPVLRVPARDDEAAHGEADGERTADKGKAAKKGEGRKRAARKDEPQGWIARLRREAERKPGGITIVADESLASGRCILELGARRIDLSPEVQLATLDGTLRSAVGAMTPPPVPPLPDVPIDTSDLGTRSDDDSVGDRRGAPERGTVFKTRKTDSGRTASARKDAAPSRSPERETKPDAAATAMRGESAGRTPTAGAAAATADAARPNAEAAHVGASKRTAIAEPARATPESSAARAEETASAGDGSAKATSPKRNRAVARPKLVRKGEGTDKATDGDAAGNAREAATAAAGTLEPDAAQAGRNGMPKGEAAAAARTRSNVRAPVLSRSNPKADDRAGGRADAIAATGSVERVGPRPEPTAPDAIETDAGLPGTSEPVASRAADATAIEADATTTKAAPARESGASSAAASGDADTVPTADPRSLTGIAAIAAFNATASATRPIGGSEGAARTEAPASGPATEARSSATGDLDDFDALELGEDAARFEAAPPAADDPDRPWGRGPAVIGSLAAIDEVTGSAAVADLRERVSRTAELLRRGADVDRDADVRPADADAGPQDSGRGDAEAPVLRDMSLLPATGGETTGAGADAGRMPQAGFDGPATEDVAPDGPLADPRDTDPGGARDAGNAGLDLDVPPREQARWRPSDRSDIEDAEIVSDPSDALALDRPSGDGEERAGDEIRRIIADRRPLRRPGRTTSLRAAEDAPGIPGPADAAPTPLGDPASAAEGTDAETNAGKARPRRGLRLPPRLAKLMGESDDS